MKCKFTRKGNVQITLTQAENNTLNALLDKYNERAGKFPHIYQLGAFSRALRVLPIESSKARL